MTTILISGSRYWNTNSDYNKIKEELQKYPNANIIVGDCRGVDTLTVKACKELNYNYKIFKADWNLYGNAAGPIRNKEMVDCLNKMEGEKIVLAFHENIDESKGTKNLIKIANENKIKVILIK